MSISSARTALPGSDGSRARGHELGWKPPTRLSNSCEGPPLRCAEMMVAKGQHLPGLRQPATPCCVPHGFFPSELAGLVCKATNCRREVGRELQFGDSKVSMFSAPSMSLPLGDWIPCHFRKHGLGHWQAEQEVTNSVWFLSGFSMVPQRKTCKKLGI